MLALDLIGNIKSADIFKQGVTRLIMILKSYLTACEVQSVETWEETGGRTTRLEANGAN